MNQKQKLRVNNRLNLQKVKDGKHPIYVRIYVDKKKAEIFSDYWVKKSEWCNKQRLVKSSNKQADLINAYLKKIHSTLVTEFYETRAQGITTSAKELKNKLIGVEMTPSQKTILQAFDYHNIKMQEQVNIGKVVPKTYTRYKITKNKVRAFMRYEYKIDDI